MTELVGWIILGVVLLILALILFAPFGVSADYADGSVSLAARVFAFELKLLPRPEREKKGAKAKKEKPAKKAKKPGEPKPEKEKKPKPPLVTREMIPELARLAGRTLSRFRRKITVNRLLIHIAFAGAADPCGAVMTYGAVNSAFGTLGAAAGRAFNVKKSDIATGVDFDADATRAELGITLTISIARILAVAAAAGLGFLKIKRRADKAAKAAAKERMEKDERDADPDGGIPQSQHS